MKVNPKLATLCCVLLGDCIWKSDAFSVGIPKPLLGTRFPPVKSPTALYESKSEGQGESSSASSLGSTSSQTSSTASVPESDINSTVSKSVTVDEGGVEQSIDVGTVKTSYRKRANEIWGLALPIKVQGGSLRTWSFVDPEVEKVQVLMNTEGRPLHATIDLWQGPDNTPQKMAVYIEDGNLRRFNAVIAAPGTQNAIAIRNTAQIEYPLTAAVVKAEADLDILRPAKTSNDWTTIQGGAVRTYNFAVTVRSVRIVLKSDGRPMNARIELLQGPNNSKQVIEIYTEDGELRQFYGVLETPGNENVVRVVNTATMEFPLMAFVTPYEIGEGQEEDETKEDFYMKI